MHAEARARPFGESVLNNMGGIIAYWPVMVIGLSVLDLFVIGVPMNPHSLFPAKRRLGRHALLFDSTRSQSVYHTACANAYSLEPHVDRIAKTTTWQAN